MPKKIIFLITVVFFLLSFSKLKTLAINYMNGMSATVVVGQTDMTHYTANQYYPSASSNWGSRSVATDGTRLFVADDFNNRVLIYNTIPTSTNQPADVVIGQVDMTHNEDNQGGAPAANTLWGPKSIATDGTKLIISDGQNRRILIYNTIPTTNNASADVVIGQPNMTTNTQYTTADNTFSFSPIVSYDSGSGKLFISDLFNHRVLIYNSIPTSNFASANVVIGQPDFTSNSANQGATASAFTLSVPYNAKVMNNKLFVSDNNNSRVLIFNTIPTVNNASADVVIGQANMSTTGELGGPSDHTMLGPEGLEWDGNRLYISDNGNDRILVYNSIPTSNGASANSVIGQTNFTNIGFGLSSTKFNNPGDLAIAGGTLFVADTNNRRVLAFGDYINSATATFVLGQVDFVSNGINQFNGASNANSFDYVYGLATNGTKLFVSDSSNNRVLIFNSIPTSNNPTADVVVGQSSMSNNSPDQGGSVGANTIDGPGNLETDGTKLFIADSSNNRVLIYNTIPTSNNASADVVIGQANSNSDSANQGGSVGANTLSGPTAVSFDPVSGKLLISDCYNNRVLIYNSIPTSDNASANVVVGQANMSGSSSDQGGVTSASGLNCPINARIYENKLFVADSGNNRVLIYNSVPTSDNASADVVIGQVDMSGNLGNQGATADGNTLEYPTDMLWDGNHLIIQDDNNNRMLIFDSIPTTYNAFADRVLGHTNFTDTIYGTSSTTFNDPEGQLAFANNKLFVGDSSNNRVLIFTDYISQSSTGGGSSSGGNGGTSCTAVAPEGSPNLYQINTNSETATLYFAPAPRPYDKYIISYGLTPKADSHSVVFDSSNSSGAIKYKINSLTKNTKYYFKVRAGYDCTAGSWSETLLAKTSKSKSSIIRNYPPKKVKTGVNK
jgi:hypothetical protein